MVTFLSSSFNSEKRVTFFRGGAVRDGEEMFETSLPAAIWNLRTTERRASSGGIMNSSSYLRNSLIISVSSAPSHSSLTTAICAAYLPSSLISSPMFRDNTSSLLEPGADQNPKIQNRPRARCYSVWVGVGSTPHRLRDMSSSRGGL